MRGLREQLHAIDRSERDSKGWRLTKNRVSLDRETCVRANDKGKYVTKFENVWNAKLY